MQALAQAGRGAVGVGIADKGGDGVHDGLDRGEGAGVAQGADAVGEGGEFRQQHEQAPAEGVQRAQRVGLRGGVPGEVGGEQVDFGQVAGEVLPFDAQAGVFGLAGEGGEAPAGGAFEPLLEPSGEHGLDPAGEHDGGHDAGAGDADADLLDAGDGGGEDLGGGGDGGEADDGRGVAGEHENVAARGAVEEGEVEADCGPERHGEGEQDLRVGQVGDDGDRAGGADEGAEKTVDGFRAGGAGEGLGRDVDGRHGPVGAVEVEGEADIERDDGGGEGAHGE